MVAQQQQAPLPTCCAASLPSLPFPASRFILVVEGQLEIEVNGKEVLVRGGHFAYQPPSSEEFLSQT